MVLTNPQIDLQQTVANEIREALDAEILSYVRDILHDASSNNFAFKSGYEGFSLKVAPEILPDLNNLLTDVKKKLHFDAPIDLYVTDTAPINAVSYESEDENLPHVIELNSKLIDLCTTDELRFTIGHEIGHLINHDGQIRALIDFVYPKPDDMPRYLNVRNKVYDHLSEFSADRYGFIAAGKNIEVCVSAFYKMVSGIDLPNLHVSIDALAKNNEERLKFFYEQDGNLHSDHPVLPVRIHTLKVYATNESQKEVDECIDNYVTIFSGKLLNLDMCLFCIALGLYVAQLDGPINQRELEEIVRCAGLNCIFAYDMIENVQEQGVEKVLEEQFAKLKENNMIDPDAVVDYLLVVLLADHSLSKEEIDYYFAFGQQLGYVPEELSDKLVEALHTKTYFPKITSF